MYYHKTSIRENVEEALLPETKRQKYTELRLLKDRQKQETPTLLENSMVNI